MMSLFDKICAVPAIIVGIVFMFLGAAGLFVEVKAYFTLPPILGVLPFFLGWSMSVVLIKYWKLSDKLKNNNHM